MTKDIPKCFYCGKAMKPAYDSIAKKVTGYLWKFDCECVEKYPKLKGMKISVG